MEYRSRLKQRLRKTTLRSTILYLGAVFAIFAVVFFFGLNALVKFSLFLGNIKSITEIPTTSDNKFILPPILDPLVEATNSAVIEVSGIGTSQGQTVELFLNGQYKTNALVDSELKFKVPKLRLAEGENRIKVKAKVDGKESEFTDEITLVFETIPPALEVSEPHDGQLVKKISQVKVVGKTEPDTSILINDFLPVVEMSGKFSFTFPLKEGDNLIKVIARDKAGNQTTNELKVIFEP